MDGIITEIGQIALSVSSIEKVLPFYRDVLGLNYLFSPSPNLAFLKVGSTRIMLSTSEEGITNVGKNSILYFRVKQIENIYKLLLRKGAIGERSPSLTAKMPEYDL